MIGESDMKSIRIKSSTIICLGILAGCLLIGLSTCGLSEPPKDSRLERKVSIKTGGMTLAQLTSMLSSETGVKIATMPENADYRVVVMVKDLPLGELLESVAESLHLKLQREEKDGEWKYCFQEDAATTQEAARLRKKSAELLPGQMARAAEALKLPEDQIQKIIREDKILEPFLDQKQFRIGVALYGWLDESRRNRLLTQNFLSIRLSGLPDNLRRDIVTLFNENQRQREKAENIKLNDRLVAIHWEYLDDPLSGRSLWLNLIGSNNNNLSLVFNPSSESGPDLVGNEDLFTIKTEKDPVLGGVYVVVPKGKLQGHLGERAKAKFDKEVDLPRALERVHESDNVNFVSDFFLPRYAMSSRVGDWTFVRGETLGQLIEKISGLFHCTWKMHGDVCVLSSKEWFDDRSTVIPQSKITRWQESLRTKGYYGLDELLEMASLNDKAIKALQHLGVSYPSALQQNLRALRFLASLSPEQRQVVEGKKGLSAAGLEGSALDAFLTWMESPVGQDQRPSKFNDDDVAKAVVHLTRQDEATYIFTIETSDGRTRVDTLKTK